MDGDAADYVVIASHLITTKYATVASAALLVWDMGMTFDQEVSMVWHARKSLGTTLFFLNRYLTPAAFALEIYSQFVANPTLQFCEQYAVWSFVLCLISTAIVLWVLIMRVHALYQNRGLKLLLVGLSTIAIANMLTSLLVIFHFNTHERGITFGTTGCLCWCTKPICHRLSITYWIPYIFVETIIFVLTIWKSYKTLRKSRLTGDTTSDTMNVLIRDGLVYYFVIMTVSLGTFLVWIMVPWSPDIVTGLFKSLQATMCSRILLNLRGLLEKRSQIVSQPKWQSMEVIAGS